MSGTVNGAVESAEQLLGMWTALVEDLGAKATTTKGVARRWADTAFGFYNTLSFADFGIDPSKLAPRLDQAVAFMRGSENVGFLWLFEELLTDAARFGLAGMIEQAGLTRAMTCYGMAGDILPLPEPADAGLRFERVATQEHLDAYAGLNAQAYQMSENDVQSAFAGSRLWTNDIYAYLGFEGDRPVCCAGSYPVDGCLFVAMVATVPDCQRRGFGEAVTRKALYEGAKATGPHPRDVACYRCGTTRVRTYRPGRHIGRASLRLGLSGRSFSCCRIALQGADARTVADQPSISDGLAKIALEPVEDDLRMALEPGIAVPTDR
jgi:GNAT superfamily N-acetyltransferase